VAGVDLYLLDCPLCCQGSPRQDWLVKGRLSCWGKVVFVGPQQVPKTGRGYFGCSSALSTAGLGVPWQVDILVEEAASFVDGKGCKDTYETPGWLMIVLQGWGSSPYTHSDGIHRQVE
jgi:hypothetical protein